MEGVRAWKGNHRTKPYTESPTKNITNLPSTIKRFTLCITASTVYNADKLKILVNPHNSNTYINHSNATKPTLLDNSFIKIGR